MLLSFFGEGGGVRGEYRPKHYSSLKTISIALWFNACRVDYRRKKAQTDRRGSCKWIFKKILNGPTSKTALCVFSLKQKG